jgi:hypothetical protein
MGDFFYGFEGKMGREAHEIQQTHHLYPTKLGRNGLSAKKNRGIRVFCFHFQRKREAF